MNKYAKRWLWVFAIMFVANCSTNVFGQGLDPTIQRRINREQRVREINGIINPAPDRGLPHEKLKTMPVPMFGQYAQRPEDCGTSRVLTVTTGGFKTGFEPVGLYTSGYFPKGTFYVEGGVWAKDIGTSGKWTFASYGWWGRKPAQPETRGTSKGWFFDYYENGGLVVSAPDKGIIDVKFRRCA